MCGARKVGEVGYALSITTSSPIVDMVNDSLRQRRSFRPNGNPEKGVECFARKRIGNPRSPAHIRASQVEEETVMAKRNIFGDLMEGVAAMKGHREGKITLRSYKVDVAPLPKVDSRLLRDTRKKLHCSRAVFARKLRINERTLEKWEQGLAKPNPQAAALVLLVRKYPDTLERLDALGGR